MKISKAKYRCDIEAARQEGKREVLNDIARGNWAVYGADIGMAASAKLPIAGGDVEQVLETMKAEDDKQ